MPDEKTERQDTQQAGAERVDPEAADLESAGDPPDRLDHTGGAVGISQAPDPGYDEYVRRHGPPGTDESTDEGDATAGDVGDPAVKGDTGTSADVGYSGGIGATGEKRGAHKPR